MHNGHRDRLKSRFKKVGLDGLADHEILELLLFYAQPRRDVNGIAHELLRKFGTLNDVFLAEVSELVEVDGVGDQIAMFIRLIGATHKHLSIRKLGERPRLSSPEIAVKYIANLFQGESSELFYILLLDSQQRLIRVEKIASGDQTQVHTNPRMAVKLALNSDAAYVIIAHNHPGGSYKPSRADIQVTDIFNDILSAVGIKLADHYVFTEKTTYSISHRQTFDNNVVIVNESDGVLDSDSLVATIRSLDLDSLDDLISKLGDTYIE